MQNSGAMCKKNKKAITSNARQVNEIPVRLTDRHLTALPASFLHTKDHKT